VAYDGGWRPTADGTGRVLAMEQEQKPRVVTIFDELLGIGDPADWAYMREQNEPCDGCTCCRAVVCAGADEFDHCADKGCPCTSG